MTYRKGLNLFNSAIDIPKQRELTPIKVLLQAKVGIRPNPVFHTKRFQLFSLRLDGFQAEVAKALQGLDTSFPAAGASYQGETKS
jgi:hypothetical protein